MKIICKPKNIFITISCCFLTLILLAATVLGAYMFIRSRGQLKNNSLSTKLDAFNINNDFDVFSGSFDKEFDNILFCGIDKFNNTDVIMIISINKKYHNIKVLRIPRDIYIGDNYLTGKINSVYSQPKPNLTGADTLTYEINNIFRVKIDKYIFMTLDVFEKMIDDIGGVNITLDRDIPIDKNNIIKAGKVHLNGKTGTDFVRHRKSYVMGDIGRIYAQEQFIKQLATKLVNDNYFKNISFLNKYYNLIETNIGRKEVNLYIKATENIDTQKIKTFVIEGTPVTYNGYSVYVADIDKTVDLLNKEFMPKGVSIKKSDLKLVESLQPDLSETTSSKNNSSTTDDFEQTSLNNEFDDYEEIESENFTDESEYNIFNDDESDY